MNKWTQEERETATWTAGRIAKNVGGAVDAAIELACQRNEMLRALTVMRNTLLLAGGDPIPTLDALIAKAEASE